MEETGQTEAVGRAVVSARIQGVLQEVRFEPDEQVEKDQTLYLIEPDFYDEAVKSAKAALAGAEAEEIAANAAIRVAEAETAQADAAVKVSEANYNRLKGLFENNAIPKSELEMAEAQFDTAKAKRQAAAADSAAKAADLTKAEAQVKQAKANLSKAELDKVYTEVKAPIAGRVTKTDVKVGNLVDNGTELVTIVQNDPIWANFNISERFLLTMEDNAKRNENQEIDLPSIRVELQRMGDTDFPFEGHLDYYDPEIDQATGTLALRAVFENSDRSQLLLPGLFVRVRVEVGQIENAILIPELAVSRDQVGSYVYVVDSDNKVARKNIVLGPKYREMIVVLQGLSADDDVIVVGIQNARAGEVVETSTTTLTMSAEPPSQSSAVEAD